MLAKLAWNANMFRTPLAETAVYSYNGNDIFDPDPLVSTNFAASRILYYASMYTAYTVYGSSITVTVTNNADTWPVSVVIWPTMYPSSNLGGNLNYTAALPNAIHFYVNAKGSSGNMVTRKSYFSTAKVFGREKSTVDALGPLSAATNQSPVSKWVWRMKIFNANPVVDAVDCIIRVKINYYTKFWQRDIETIE